MSSLKKSLHITKKDTVVIFVGRLAQEKNIEFLIKNHKKIIRNKPNIKLMIVGDGPDREKLENYANELGIGDNVIFTGKVAWEDIPYYYHVSDIFATASTSETQGLTVVEAMAANLPAVCIDDEAFQGTIVDQLNGFIFKDEKEYCDLILKLNKSVKEREKIGNQGRIQAQHLSSSQYAENVLVVYNIAIKNKNKYRYGIFSKAIDKIKEIKNDSSTKQ